MWVASLWIAACAAPVDTPVVAAGLDHSCELRGGAVRCWGGDAFGQLGGAELRRMRGVRALAAGGNTTCIIDSGDDVWCVGQNHRGQLGDGTLRARPAPVRVRGLPPIAQVSVGFAHVCARGASGEVCCWGWGASGQLEPGGDRDSPSPVCHDLDARWVVAGFDTTCAIDRDARLTCWGAVGVPATGGVRDVAIGADHACALRDAEVVCHGSPPGGGRAPLAGARSLPFSGGRLASGAIDHLCLTDRTSALHCLGKNEHGQLGDGTFVRRDAPSAVRRLPRPVTSVAVGFGHTCAVAAGQTYCWGWNEQGQLGDASGIDSLDPHLVDRGWEED